ncbi:hypothetical protein [Halosolutus halophilus]|uniref:hypothetical protein n=1 Tax=Halosolutus halophilus TaxID=1552990 RepID=UPI002235029F|nr:hypothetical protein [Halosolutus halophilus]
MSVIRQPEVLGRTTRRRVVGVTAALSATAVETLAVGLWFGLVVGPRTAATALAGLGILFCGSLLRAGVFGVTVSEDGDLLQPRRLGAALLLTAGWVVWLWVAELIDGVPGLVVATVVLVWILAAQFIVERRVFRCRITSQIAEMPIGPALLLAAGAATLLVSVWFVEWTATSPALSLGVTSFVVWIDALHLGVFVFVMFSFLAHQHRFQRLLNP